MLSIPFMIDNERKTGPLQTVGFILLILMLAVRIPTAVAQDAGIQWYSMEKAQALAKKNGKKVLAYAVTSWCVYCKKMNENVLPEQAVIDSLNRYFYPVKISIDSNDTLAFNSKKITARQFAQKYNVRATPTTIFIDNKGNVMGQQPGYVPADMFSRLLAYMGSEAFLKMDFKMYMQKYVKSEKN